MRLVPPHLIQMVVPMPASHLTHDLVCIGSHEPRQHDFHAANARAVAELFTGGLGPSRLVADCLAGPRVKTGAVMNALEASASRAAKNHVVYFSGRGSRFGLEVSDGTISPQILQRHLSQVRAHAVLLVLDLAVGAEPDHALTPSWLRALVQAQPRVRVAVARATRIGAGAEREGLARFTAALITALEAAPGDVRHDGTRFISDSRALDHTRRTLEQRWGMTDFPLELGEFGNMPLTRSQVQAPVGTAQVEAVVAGAGLSVSVSWMVEGRAHMTTMLEYVLEQADGAVVGRGVAEIVAKNPLQKGKTRVRLPKSVLGRRGTTSAASSPLRWRVALRDTRGRVLADCVIDLP